VGMTDTDRGSGGSDRQLEFLQEAFGLSEAEAKEVLEEYEGLQNRSEPTREVVDIDSGRLGRLLDTLWNQRERAEDQLYEDGAVDDAELAENVEDGERIRFEPADQEGPFDIYEIDGERLIPYGQVREVLVQFNQHVERSINELDELINHVEEIDRESVLSEEAKQAIDKIYERANEPRD